jgi:hypothetical protein
MLILIFLSDHSAIFHQSESLQLAKEIPDREHPLLQLTILQFDAQFVLSGHFFLLPALGQEWFKLAWSAGLHRISRSEPE